MYMQQKRKLGILRTMFTIRDISYITFEKYSYILFVTCDSVLIITLVLS